MYLQAFTLFGTYLLKKRRKNGAINFNAMIENSFSFKLNGSRSHLKKDGSFDLVAEKYQSKVKIIRDQLGSSYTFYYYLHPLHLFCWFCIILNVF